MMRLPLVAVAALALLAPATAAAQSPGSLTITVNPRAEQALKARSVTLSATGKATRKGRRVQLPLSKLDRKSLRTAGTLRLRAHKRTVTLGSPRLELGSNPRVTALLSGRRTTVLTLAVAPLTDATGVTLERTGASLTAKAAKTIARRLRVKSLSRTNFATVTAIGNFPAAAPALPPSAPALPGACRSTTAAGAAPTPPRGEPPVKAAPAGALNVVSATLSWQPRPSFIRYINSAEGTKSSNGASDEPASVQDGTPVPLVYGFGFTSTGGWCDPATGSTRLTFAGTVAFSYKAHGIDLRVNDPEVELDGPASRVIFRMTGSGNTDGGNRRSVVETLDVSRAAAVHVDGKTITYERVPAAIPPGAADSVFAGYYLPGDSFGWVSVSFTTG